MPQHRFIGFIGFSRNDLVHNMSRKYANDPEKKLVDLLRPVKRVSGEVNWETLQKQLILAFAEQPALPLLLWKETKWPYPFALVLREELIQIDTRRAHLRRSEAIKKDPAQAISVAKTPVDDGGNPIPPGKIPDRPTATAIDVSDLAADMGLTGLAFSGGGIRSATFNLGVLQKLADWAPAPNRLHLQRFRRRHRLLAGGVDPPRKTRPCRRLAVAQDVARSA